MAENNHDTLTNIHPNQKIEWKINVRVSRMWREVNRQDGQIRGIHLILVDQTNTRVHAWIDRQHMNNLQEHFAETQLVEIANFSVNFYSYDAKNICFENDKYISLMEETIVTPRPDIVNIPEQVFNFTEFQDLPRVAEQNRYLTYIIGVLTSFEPILRLANIDTGKQVTFAKFVLTNRGNNARVVFKNHLAEQINAAFNQNIQLPMILIVSSCKVNQTRGYVTITSYPATRFFVNPENDAAAELRLQMGMNNMQIE